MVEETVNPDFQSIRDSLKIPGAFPPDVVAAARLAATRDPRQLRIEDATRIPFVTIDPPGSMDLDQAYAASRTATGYRVDYAIDDVGFFVDRGGAIEQEAFRRGCTNYSPDIKTPLYPSELSEGAASLLPGQIRATIQFSFELNEAGEVVARNIRRTLIKSRAQLHYPDVAEHLEAERHAPGSGRMSGQEWSEGLGLLEKIGRKRQKLEAERHAVNLRIPSQQVERWTTALFGYRLAFEESTDVEDWNAQISLMTGMEAARVMMDAGVGLLRTLDPPRPDKLTMLRLTARALGVEWPEGVEYGDFIRMLDPKTPVHAVIIHQAAKLNGGARYQAFNGELPRQSMHAGLGAHYAHTTAPLRRLCDRYVLDLLVELGRSRRPDAGDIGTLCSLPEVMMETDRRSRQLESAIVDFAETRLMEDQVGKEFAAMVIGLREEGIIVQITEPPIRTLVPVRELGGETGTITQDGSVLGVGERRIELGDVLQLRLVQADVKSRRLDFSLV